MRWRLIWLFMLAGGMAATGVAGPAKARHVVLVVWDGMRPDSVSEKDTPALFQLGTQGVIFDDHHATYVSLTEGNGTAIATGAYPARTGILGDTEYRPEIDPLQAVHMEDWGVVRKGDAAERGRYVGAPTLPEILRRAGRKTATAGAKGVVLLADRIAGPNLFAGHTLPENLLGSITNLLGDFPEAVAEQPSRDDWTTGALLDPLWPEGVPDLSILWLNEPDLAQHRTGVGSEHSLAVIRNDDQNLARVLRALESRGARETTDIIVVSDHGFSTISAVVDLADALGTAGLPAHRNFTAPPKRGDVMVVGNGASVFIYVIGREDAVIKQVVDFLQGWSRTGVIFTRQAMAGTFALAQVHNEATTAPDVLVSLRWTADKNDAGVPGMLFSDVSGFGAGQGMHCSLSRFDMHNTLIAAGPDFRAGVVDHLPTGNVDLAPTILWILGRKPPKTMDGRVLTEALTIPGPKIQSFEPRHLAAEASLENAVWHQYLNFTEVNGVVYYDEGNGYQIPK